MFLHLIPTLYYLFPTVLTQDAQPVQFASGVLARLLSLVGHVALRQLVHLDLSVFGEMKRRRAIQEQKDWIQTPASKQNKAKVPRIAVKL